MELEKGLLFTGRWFKGRVEVLKINEELNELEVMLHRNVNPAKDEQHWFETWNLSHTLTGFNRADYFLIK